LDERENILLSRLIRLISDVSHLISTLKNEEKIIKKNSNMAWLIRYDMAYSPCLPKPVIMLYGKDIKKIPE